MKKIIFAILAIICGGLSVRAQVPSSWGNVTESYVIPVPYEKTGVIDSYLFVRTDKGIGFVGENQYHFYPKATTLKDVGGKLYYETPNGNVLPLEVLWVENITGAFFVLVEGIWVFRPAVSYINRNGSMYWCCPDSGHVLIIHPDEAPDFLKEKIAHWQKNGVKIPSL